MIIYSLPVIGALIGWIGACLALKMLFYPRTEKKLLFFSVQGLLPKKQPALARTLGRMIAAELFSMQDLTLQLKASATSDAAMTMVAQRLEEAINQKLPPALPMLAMFLNDGVKGKIKGALLGHLQGMLGELTEMLSATLEQDLDVEAFVEKKVAALPVDRIEEILTSTMQQELKHVEMMGGALGFVIGVVHLLLLTFAP